MSMSASPAPSVAGTSVGRPSVPPASPPPSRDQVVMGGQPSAGVSVSGLGSAPSGSVIMATGYVSVDVVPASPDPPPPPVGRGGSRILLAPHSLALPALLLRRESGEGGGTVSVRVLPLFPLGIAPVPVLESAEREDRDIASAPESDVIVPVTRSDLAALAPALLLESILSSVHAKRSLYRSRSRERAYRSRTPSERGDRSERYDKGATSLLGKKKKRSDVSAVRQMLEGVMSGFQKSLEAFGDNASNSSSTGASSRGTPSPREERPAKSVSSSRQGEASSSRVCTPSRLEEREREERSRRSTHRPDRSSGDRGQSPPRKRRRSRSPSVLSFSGSDNVSLHPSDSLSNEVDGGSEMRAPTLPASVPPGADAGHSGSHTSRDRSPQPGPSFQTQSDATPRERRAGEHRDTRSFPAAPGGEEDERAGSTEPPVLEKDAPFRQVLKSIRDYHCFPTPLETTPHPDRSAMARHLGLPLDHAPALHLPASQLTKALIDDVNAHMRKFGEDQTQGALLPIPGRRSRRFYRTSKPLFPAPYQIPPGVAPLFHKSSTDVKRRPTTYSPSLSSSQEVLLSSACETASWIDLALPACSNFGSRLPADSKPEFERMMLSVGRAVEFPG